MPSWVLERQLAARYGGPVVGVDEAGRGAWAGPLAVAVVAFDPSSDGDPPPLPAEGARADLDDSKRLTPAQRTAWAAWIRRRARAWGVALIPAPLVDRLGLTRATALGVHLALQRANLTPAVLLVDGRVRLPLPWPQRTVVGGDGLSYSVAAASILAKTTRDRWMQEVAARQWPGYGFERHVGYGTAEHRRALARLGPCPLHRRRFRPVAEAALRAGWP